MLSFFHRFCTSLKELRTAVSLKNAFGFLSNKCCTPLYKETDKMMRLCARTDMALSKECHMIRTDIGVQGMYWRTSKGNATTCLLILFSSLGYVVFPPMVSTNFLGRVPKPWENQQNMHT
jgi:hypothetical protein